MLYSPNKLLLKRKQFNMIFWICQYLSDRIISRQIFLKLFNHYSCMVGNDLTTEKAG